MSENDLKQRFNKAMKLRLVSESFGLKGEDLGRYLRSNGISSCELRDWREQMTDALDEGRPVERNEKKSLNNKIALLEKEVGLLKKDLEEARLLIELQKKVQKVLEDDKAASIVKKSGKRSSR